MSERLATEGLKELETGAGTVAGKNQR